MKNNSLFGLFSLCILMFIGCGPKVTTTKTSDTNLNKFKTFAYLPNDEVDMGYDDDTVGERVINEVNAKMKDLGYELNRKNPDILVLLATKTNTDYTKNKDPIYATYPRYYGVAYPVRAYYEPYYYYDYPYYTEVVGYDTDWDKYEEGTLLVSLVGRKSKELLWRGSASDVIIRPNETAAITEYVDDLFEEFPAVSPQESK